MPSSPRRAELVAGLVAVEWIRADARARCRDFDCAQPKPEGVKRVLCLGNSFTWHVGVMWDDAWPQRVESLD